MTNVYDLDRAQLEAVLDGEPAFRVQQVWDGLHRRARRIEEMTEVPLALRQRLGSSLGRGLREVRRRSADGDDTVKVLWALEDGARVETVVMAYPRRVTVCVSTQAGCAMGCEFCATGQAGFFRHLSTGEIVEQVVAATRLARPRRVTHVVFMGMGEPLANYRHVWSAVERLHDDVGISARRLTISTVGVVPGIRQLAAERLPVNLAVSLHAANDALRDRLVPINRRYPLRELARACDHYVTATGRRLSLEWALIEGVNDGPAHVEQLASFARPLRAHVNVIPLNPTPAFGVQGTSRQRVKAFRDELAEHGVNVTIRSTRGTEIEAACGQLAGGGVRPPRPSARLGAPERSGGQDRGEPTGNQSPAAAD